MSHLPEQISFRYLSKLVLVTQVTFTRTNLIPLPLKASIIDSGHKIRNKNGLSNKVIYSYYPYEPDLVHIDFGPTDLTPA